MIKILFFLLLTEFIYSQQQTDIPWPTLAKTDWPMIKHDPQFTGRSPFKGPQTPTVIWTLDMKDGIFSGPVIGENGNLYFGSYYQDPQLQGLSDYFYCYSSNGNYNWDFKLGGNRPPQSGILIDSSNTIYFGSLDKYIYALNSDGSLKWKYLTSAAIPELAIPNIDLLGNIYITHGYGELYSIKPDGTLNWNVNYESGFSCKSPVFSPDGNTIYIAGRDSNLFALNLDGSIKWKFNCINISKAVLVDCSGNLYFTPGSNFCSLYPNGTVRWQIDIVGIDYSVPTIDIKGNLYICAKDSSYHKLISSYDYSGNYRWSCLLDTVYNEDIWQPLICDSEGTVYVGSTDGNYYYCISSEGNIKWKLPLEFDKKMVDNTGAFAEDGTLYIGVHGGSFTTGATKTLIAIKDTGTVSVHENDYNPTEYILSQNYPNPFNSNTKIIYAIPLPGLATLKVYDVLGNDVAVLVNEYKDSGTHIVDYNAGELSSGIYFYQLRAGSFIKTLKFILQK